MEPQAELNSDEDDCETDHAPPFITEPGTRRPVSLISTTAELLEAIVEHVVLAADQDFRGSSLDKALAVHEPETDELPGQYLLQLPGIPAAESAALFERVKHLIHLMCSDW